MVLTYEKTAGKPTRRLETIGSDKVWKIYYVPEDWVLINIDDILSLTATVSSVLGALSTIAAAFVVWRVGRQSENRKRFKKKLRLAISILEIISIAEQKLFYILRPPTEEEERNAKQYLNLEGRMESALEDHKKIIHAQVMGNKIRNEKELIENIRDLMPKAKAIIGKDLSLALEELLKIFMELEHKSESLSGLSDDDLKHLFFDIKNENESSEMKKRIYNKIELIEKICNPIAIN